MDSLRRGYPTNDAVLRQHAMMMAAGAENEWHLTGSDDDGPTVTFHGTWRYQRHVWRKSQSDG